MNWKDFVTVRDSKNEDNKQYREKIKIFIVELNHSNFLEALKELDLFIPKEGGKEISKNY